MSKVEDFTFYDKNGTSYEFEVYPAGTTFNSVAGVYIFTKRWINQRRQVVHTLIYVGETQSFKDRPLDNGHPKWQDARKKGFSHICVYPTNNHVAIQNRLIAKYNPSLNKT